MELIKRLNDTLPTDEYARSVNAIQICHVKDNDDLLLYESHAGGGGMASLVYLAKLSSNGAITKVSEIKDEGFPYFGCTRILQYVNNGFWNRRGGRLSSVSLRWIW